MNIKQFMIILNIKECSDHINLKPKHEYKTVYDYIKYKRMQ